MTFGGTHGGVEEAQKALNVNKKREKHREFMAVCVVCDGVAGAGKVQWMDVRYSY